MKLKQYDDAFAHNFNKGITRSGAISCLEFHYQFLNCKKTAFFDTKNLRALAKNYNWVTPKWDYKTRLDTEVILVTDKQLRIVFASKNITQMNGYKATDVLGKSPKIFHGADTDPITSKEIRECVYNQVPFEKTVLNYRKNGTVYICHIKGFPIFDNKGLLSHFIAFEKVA